MTEDEVRERLRAAIEAAGGQQSFAKAHGFTPAYINDVVHGRRALADRILMAIGIKRVISFETRYEDTEQK